MKKIIDFIFLSLFWLGVASICVLVFYVGLLFCGAIFPHKLFEASLYLLDLRISLPIIALALYSFSFCLLSQKVIFFADLMEQVLLFLRNFRTT